MTDYVRKKNLKTFYSFEKTEECVGFFYFKQQTMFYNYYMCALCYKTLIIK